jgi:hypothetical protein
MPSSRQDNAARRVRFSLGARLVYDRRNMKRRKDAA